MGIMPTLLHTALTLVASHSLFAAAPVNLKITRAMVTWGVGVEPKEAMPLGHFEARVLLSGRKHPFNPVFRVWRVKISDFPDLEKNRAKCPPLSKTHRLEATATRMTDGIWVLRGAWLGAPEPEDRLVVEVRAGSRHLGWASSQLAEQLIQTLGKPPRTPRDD